MDRRCVAVDDGLRQALGIARIRLRLWLLSQMGPPHFPTPIGVLRAIEAPVYESAVAAQYGEALARHGEPDLQPHGDRNALYFMLQPDRADLGPGQRPCSWN